MNQPVRKSRSSRRARTPDRSSDYQNLDFTRKNWLLFGAGLLAILAGFGFLSRGDITLAPILLVSGYLVLIPWAILTRTPADSVQNSGNGGE